MILDTGADPSAVDTRLAEMLGLAIDRAAGGEASGERNDASSMVFPTTIADLAISGHHFGSVDALALDMSGLSKQYGKPLDGVLGYSFLNGRTVLIDYPHRTASILAPRVANVGNRIFAAMKLKMLLDCQSRRMTFYGDCR